MRIRGPASHSPTLLLRDGYVAVLVSAFLGMMTIGRRYATLFISVLCVILIAIYILPSVRNTATSSPYYNIRSVITSKNVSYGKPLHNGAFIMIDKYGGQQGGGIESLVSLQVYNTTSLINEELYIHNIISLTSVG